MRWNIALPTAILAMTIIAGGTALNRADRAIDCIAKANVELVKANTQLAIANQHIAEMHLKLADTSRKLDETNANLTLTNTKFVALDAVFQKFTMWRK